MKTCNRCFSIIPAFVAIVVMASSLCLFPLAAGAQTSVGIYSSASGTVCTLADNGPHVIEAYVVVRPDQDGSTGVQFAAPKPDCFTATYMADVAAPNTLTIGNSQTGISIALMACRSGPTHALTIQYFGAGTTPACCPYPVVNDPSVSDVVNVDCQFVEQPAAGLVAYVNPDPSCECGGNSPPSKPDQPNPASGAMNVSVHTSLGWFASDIDNNLAEYDVYLGTDPSPPLVATVTGATYTPPAPLQELAMHYWRVVARDSGGLETSSDLWTFTTRAANSSPSPPGSPDPVHGAVYIPVNVNLSWLCSDIDGDTLVYDVYMGTTINPPLLASNVPTNYFAPPTLVYNTKYFWRVVARDPLGLEQSGPVWNFTTKPSNTPPTTPSIPSPANNAVNVSVNVALAWNSTDADGDSLWFDVYFGTATTPPLLATGIAQFSYQLPALLEGTRYYWRIVAHDQAASTSGPVWTFQTIGPNLPPAVPSLPAPPNLANNISVLTTLGWQCSDPNGDALRYDVYFGTTSPPPLVVTNTPSRVYDPPGSLSFSQQYFWRVVARDVPFGLETPGPEWTFTTRANWPPNPPSNPVPPNNGVTSTAPLLSWTCTDPDGQPLTFQVYFGTTTSPPLVATVTARNYNPGILAEGDYYWRIVADDGELATNGPLWKFTASGSPTPGAGGIEIWADPGRSVCSLQDQGVTLMNAYVFLRIDGGGATGVQFAAPKPPCFTGLWVGDLVQQPFLYIGNSQEGVSLAFTSCLTFTTPIMTIQYLGLGTSLPCCE